MRNAAVITCARGEERLKAAQTRNPGLHIRICDVGKTGQRKELAAWILENFPSLNVLINNAGIQNRMNLLEQSKTWDEYGQEIEINFDGPVHLTMLLIEHLTKRNNAAIANSRPGVFRAAFFLASITPKPRHSCIFLQWELRRSPGRRG